jgi:hypothetical protein
MGDDEEKGEYDTPINKARPVNKRELEDETTIIRKSPPKRDDDS